MVQTKISVKDVMIYVIVFCIQCRFHEIQK
jgi:hypothetical protein